MTKICPDCQAEVLSTSQPAAWECMGRKQSLPEPGECNWPDCGCDPHAMKVIKYLLEQGWTGPAALAATPAVSGLEAMAEIVHNARWPADRQMAITPFADEDRNGCEYCFRIARAVLAAQPTSQLRGREPLLHTLQDIAASRWDENADLDSICSAAESAIKLYSASPPEQPAAAPVTGESGWPPQFELMKLQARPPEGGDWIDIFPAQLYSMAKSNDVRALEQTTASNKETQA